MAIKRMKLVGDFETTTTPDDVRVWASCLVDIETAEPVFIDNNINSMFEYLSNKNTVAYFHNLKFDGEFIISYLLNNGFKYSDKKESKTFNTLITDGGIFYSIEVIFEKKGKKYKKVKFLDSFKKLPFKVAVISKAFNIPDEKLEIDYEAPRPVGHVLTDDERQYIINDCVIVAKALKIQFEQNLTKMTNASDALSNFKNIVGLNQFDYLFPSFPVEMDADIRQSYKGGFTYLRPKFKDKRIKKGLTLDVNSLYPSVMYSEILPYGYPIFFEGKYEHDETFPLYICRIRVQFHIKDNHIPTIQMKNNYRFVPTEYLTSSEEEIVELTLTSVDLKLFLDHYHIDYIEYVCGWKFKGLAGIFKTYIDYWGHIKETSTGAIRQLAKLMLNSLYGKFATNPRSRQKIPYLDDNGVVKYTLTDEEFREPVYTAIAAFITAYARNKTIRSAQSVYKRFIYADTDSLHLKGYEIPNNLDIHPTRLGAWKNEGYFCDSKFIRPKTYLESVITYIEPSLYNYCKLLNTTFNITKTNEGIQSSYLKVTCAGMPDNVKEKVNYTNFKSGAIFDGKLVPRRYVGGVVLENSTFTIQ